MFAPAVVPFAGILDEPDGILACPRGRKQLSFTVPRGLPPGSEVLFQAMAFSHLIPLGEVPTFTAMIRATVV